MMNEIRPLHHLVTAGKLYPAAWKMVDQFRADRGKSLPAWPRWCFMPMAGWYAIVSADQGGAPIIDLNLAQDISRLAAIGTWRYTQGIYRFDADLQAELTDTILTGEMPVEVLLRLPEWCVYIETPGRTWLETVLHGFWAHLEWDTNDGRIELRLLLDLEDSLTGLPLHLGPWPLVEAVTRFCNEGARQSMLHKRGALLRPADADQALAESVNSLLAMILYLCSDEPEIKSPDGTTPSRPEPKRTKKGWRLFPPDKPKIWRIGEEIGSILRRGRAIADSPGAKSPRSHIRRAHWHGYWIGSGEQKRFKYKWLSPIVVQGRENNGAEKELP